MSAKVKCSGGKLVYLYSDELAGLSEIPGSLSTFRASHIEPCGTGWMADLRPSGGPLLKGFALRSEALAAEIQWLNENVIEKGESK